MKNLILFLLVLVGVVFSQGLNAQSVKTVKLKQTPGAFNKTEIELKAGVPYKFVVKNKGVDHEVGFVLAPKDKTDEANHIKEAYLSQIIADGETATSQEVTLERGEYVYFCPLNPTPKYSLVVQ